MKIRSWLLIGLATCDAAYAGDVTTSKSLYRSPELSARGGAGLTGMALEDAPLFNPALSGAGLDDETGGRISILSPMVEYNKDGKKLLELTSNKDQEKQITALQDLVGKPTHLGVYTSSGYMSRSFSLLAIAGVNADSMIVEDVDHSGLAKLDTRVRQDSGLVLSHGRSLTEEVRLGGSVKYVNRKQATLDFAVSELNKLDDFKIESYTDQAGAFGLDLGVQYEPSAFEQDLSFAFTVENLGGVNFKESKSGTKIDDLAQIVSVGSGLNQTYGDFELRYFADVRDLTSETSAQFMRKLSLGAESLWLSHYGVNAGIGDGYLSGSLFYRSAVCQLDVGTYAEERGDDLGELLDRRYFLRAGFIF